MILSEKSATFRDHAQVAAPERENWLDDCGPPTPCPRGPYVARTVALMSRISQRFLASSAEPPHRASSQLAQESLGRVLASGWRAIEAPGPALPSEPPR